MRAKALTPILNVSDIQQSFEAMQAVSRSITYPRKPHELREAAVLV